MFLLFVTLYQVSLFRHTFAWSLNRLRGNVFGISMDSKSGSGSQPPPHYSTESRREPSIADNTISYSAIQAPIPKTPILVRDLEHLRFLMQVGYRVQDVDVRGDCFCNQSISQLHPVISSLYARKNMNNNLNQPGNRTDGKKIALAIEGGGMRGCVAAGMVTSIWYLGLQNSIDTVYGSSAGSLVGAYFISGQLPYFGTEVYYDVLTTAGQEFIDAQAILRACGLGLFDLRADSLMKLFTDRMGKPVINLDYLLDRTIRKTKPLDWSVFWEKQVSGKQTLNVVASGLLSKQSISMSAANNNFRSIEELAHCMKASMLLPGVTGDTVRLKGSQVSSNMEMTWWKEFNSSWGTYSVVKGSEPMADAVIFEPLPYRSALRDNCTDIIVLRTRADNSSVTVKMGLMEKMIMTRFFGRKQGLPDILTWMQKQFHKLIYAEDILFLNAENRKYSPLNRNTARFFTIALPPGIPEVKRFETSRAVILDNVRMGFAAAYDALVEDRSLAGTGYEISKTIWPDSLLDSPPTHLKEVAVMDNGVAPADDEFHKALILSSDDALNIPYSKRKALIGAFKRLQSMVLSGMRRHKES